MRFVVLGDAHLWPVLWQRLPEARGDAFVAASQVFQYAVQHNLPVVASGDIFNFGQKGGVASCLAFLRDWIPQVPEFHFIVGNHDLTGYTSGTVNEMWMKAFEGLADVKHMTEFPYDLGNGEASIGGIDYCHGRDEFLAQLETAKEAKLSVLVIHQGLKEILGYEGAWEVERSDLDGAASLVICGHTHVTWEKLNSEGTSVISPGSTIPWQFDEEYEKKFPVVEMQDGTFNAVEWVDIEHRRPIIDKTANNEEERKKVLEFVESYEQVPELPETIRKPILRLRYISDEKFHEKLQELAEDKMILDLTVDRVQLTGSLNLGKLEDKPEDVDDIVVATHKHTNPGRVRDAAIEIQRTQDPEGVIDKHVREITGETQ